MVPVDSALGSRPLQGHVLRIKNGVNVGHGLWNDGLADGERGSGGDPVGDGVDLDLVVLAIRQLVEGVLRCCDVINDGPWSWWTALFTSGIVRTISGMKIIF